MPLVIDYLKITVVTFVCCYTVLLISIPYLVSNNSALVFKRTMISLACIVVVAPSLIVLGMNYDRLALTLFKLLT